MCLQNKVRIHENAMQYCPLLKEPSFAQHKLGSGKSCFKSQHLCKNTAQTKQRGNSCTVSDVHLQANTELTNSSPFLNIVKPNPKASLGVSGGTIPPQKLVSDNNNKKNTLHTVSV